MVAGTEAESEGCEPAAQQVRVGPTEGVESD